MPSLDGYSLNEKMNKLYEDVTAQIAQLKVEFNELYSHIDKLKTNPIRKKGIKSGKI